MPDDYLVNYSENLLIKNYSTVKFKNYSNTELKVNTSLNGYTTKGNLSFLNIIPIKEVYVHSEQKKYVTPCGTIFGVKLYTKGVVVIECDNVETEGFTANPGEECGLSQGDVILKLNDIQINCCAEMQSIISESGGKSISVEYERNGEIFSTRLKPILTDNNSTYRAGIWIRDSCAGLGTMTFYDAENNCFAALGHGICDADTGELLPLNSAEILPAEINNITKGKAEVPGSINGYFENDSPIGQAQINNELGLYGTLEQPASCFEPVEIANIQEVKKGNAQIICTLDNGQPQIYDVKITRVNYNEENKTKNIELEITDEELLSKTGGIVQGMSGSPILQNGKLVGAVTHVLMTNSAKGYGIFARNMYEEIEKNLI